MCGRVVLQQASKQEKGCCCCFDLSHGELDDTGGAEISRDAANKKTGNKQTDRTE
jgi:hypothetical protein